MIGFDRLQSGCCPDCNTKMKVLPRTIIGGKTVGSGGLNPTGPAYRHAYENYDCIKCGNKYSWLIKDPIPSGVC